MPWTPDATVTIGTTNYTAAALEGATVTMGRADTYSQPSAGYATVTVLTTAGVALQPALGDPLIVELDDSAGSPVRLFTGTVQAWQSDTSARGTTDVVQTTVTAVGPLSRLSRRIVESTRSAETDGDRIAWAIEEGLGVTWETWTPATDTWDDVDPALTWGALPPDLTDVDAGLYQVAALTGGGETNAYVVAAEASGSGQGVLYETRDGAIGWANADRRALNAASPLELDPTELSAEATVTSDAANLANQIALTYASGEVTADETVSIGVYGRYAATISTTLADVSAATDVAALYLERHAFPSESLRDVFLRLDTGNVTDTIVDQLLEVEVNDALTLTSLPAGLGSPQLTVFVEGVRWTLGRRTGLGLTVSPAFLSIGPSRWSTVAPDLAWTDAPPTLTWSDARSL